MNLPQARRKRSANEAAVKYRPFFIIELLYFSGPQGSCIVCCLHLKIKSAQALRGVSGVASFRTTDY